MITLVLSTEFNDRFSVGLADGAKLLTHKTVNKPFRQVELLLKTIAEMGALKSLNRIIVAKGPGDFSALRIGIATANALAYAFKIPIIGVLVTENFENEKEKLEWILKNGMNKRAGKFSVKNLVAPEYGRDANITQ
jgi:tRNA A37 threonylcarbamoyladenosine modification protein TsaB